MCVSPPTAEKKYVLNVMCNVKNSLFLISVNKLNVFVIGGKTHCINVIIICKEFIRMIIQIGTVYTNKIANLRAGMKVPSQRKLITV